MRVEFRLSMPSNNSWNGRWTGQDRNYVIKRTLGKKAIEALRLPRAWTHAFGDGWVARVDARMLETGERRQKSDGFCGYDWMVSNILAYGQIAEEEDE